MRVYIAGPMTGIEDYNFPAFFNAERRLKAAGYTVLNPARNPEGLEYHHYMDIAMAMIRSSEAVCVLPGWEKSKGARAEVAYAEALGKSTLALSFLSRIEAVYFGRGGEGEKQYAAV